MTSLDGVAVVDLSVNVPGPVASSRLLEFGARVTKVEPPAGDPLKQVASDWYAELVRGKQVVALDLKSEKGIHALGELLAVADLLITSSRPAALERLGLGWERLQADFPRLSHIAIVGFSPPRENRAGHDLTYQAAVGLLRPPSNPPSLFVDLLGAERTASEALAALHSARKEGRGELRIVALEEVARILATPLAHGLAAPSGVVGGGFPRYAIYRSGDGWVALAALEERLWDQFVRTVGDEELARAEGDALRKRLDELFRQRGSAEWDELAERHNLALAVVR